MNRRVYAPAVAPGRLATWIRKDYPRSAPARGHCYLLALCGIDYAGR
ncbi:MAG: hypothetical protein ACOYBX_07075 [Mycobacterium sp.]